jgi:hypothetical protein
VSCDASDQVVSFDALDPVTAWNVGTQNQSVFKIYDMYGVTR